MTGIPERVRQLIQSAGSNQRDIAAEIGLDATKLSKSLSGARRFTSVDLAHLAEKFDVTVDWLITGEEPALAVAARSTGGSAQVAARHARDLSQMRADLHEFGYPQGFVEVAFTPGGQWREEGDRLATAALLLLQTAQRSPAEESLGQVIEDVFGVDVGIYELGEDFDGLAATNETCRIMIVNTSLSPGRQRFTMAHELAHALVGDDQEVHLDANVHDPAGRQVPSEARANAFASSFLMPEQWLRDQIGREGLSVEAMAVMAWRLRVTPAALSIRLQGLRLIDAGQQSDLSRISEFRAASLAGQADGFGHRVAQASQTRPPGLLVRDSFAAYSNGVTTLRPYARLIGADLEELRRSLEFNGVTEAP